MVLLMIGLVFGTLVAFLPLFIKELQLDFNIGLYYTATAIASFVVRLVVAPVSDRYGRGLFISGALVCYIISMVLLAQAHTPTMFMLSAIAEGSGAGVLIPLTLALISDRSYANERGKVFALCMGGFDVGIAVGGPTFGFFAEVLGGYQGIFSLAAALAFVALIIFMTQTGKNLRHSLNFALGKVPDVYALDKSLV
jgi:MFS family permease